MLLGDGVCCKSSQGRGKNAAAYVVALEVTEKKFAQSFMGALQRLRLNPRIYYIKKKGGRRDAYYVKAYSKRFYQWWTKQTLVDFEKMFFSEAPLLKEFVRGFFESEGSYYKRDYPYYQTFCQMVNTEHAIIRLFGKALSQLSFKTSIHCHKEKRRDRKKLVYTLWILGGKNKHSKFIQSNHALKIVYTNSLDGVAWA